MLNANGACQPSGAQFETKQQRIVFATLRRQWWLALGSFGST